MERSLKTTILEDLSEKMVFIGGPRQVGKTTFAKSLLSQDSTVYLNWDNREDKKKIVQAQWQTHSHLEEKKLVILDEIHKYRHWKNFIKGEYDKNKEHLQFLVTGSARLDLYRKGGDSLQGRYHLHRLHPLTVSEVVQKTLPVLKPLELLSFPQTQNENELQETLISLLRFGGFPEPFLSQSEKKHRRWLNEKMEQFFREDVRDLERIHELSGIELLSSLIPDKVASLLSLNSIREDLDVSFKAVKHWMEILDNLYFLYRIRPYMHQRIRSLKKEPKAYLWDWSAVNSTGPRFENLVAAHLLKFCHYLHDSEGYPIELHYLRDVDKREIDFLVTYKNIPWFAVEAKTTEENPSATMYYFKERLNIPQCFQVSLTGTHDYIKEGIRIMPAWKFLSGLA